MQKHKLPKTAILNIFLCVSVDHDFANIYYSINI